MSGLAGDTFFLDDFALKVFDPKAASGTCISFDKAEFVRIVHEHHAKGAAPLREGYAPFCRHIFVPNFCGARCGTLTITDQNRHLLRSGYIKRRPEELAVLARWFPAGRVQAPQATWLDIILYSREQLVAERDALPRSGPVAELPYAPWGIISIKGQMEDYETPMTPATAMRNALGREEGGSGVPLDRVAYEEAMQFWDTHALISAGATPG
ncbi:hypothetical protein WJX81_004048 [Elliptochloris bilobata]|uniref:Flagellar associated protein n=1 Tax=Elliptochloris bilobata TaxID=381761 RepID=A0AAW1RTX1_9CHLO